MRTLTDQRPRNCEVDTLLIHDYVVFAMLRGDMSAGNGCDKRSSSFQYGDDQDQLHPAEMHIRFQP